MVAVHSQRLSLIRQLFQKQLADRYRGSLLGIFWSLLTPLTMLAIYGFVFSVVFQARFGGEEGVGTGAKGEFAVILFAGLLLHGFVAECLMRAPGLLREHIVYVKKVVFPLEILPVVQVLSALFQMGVGLVILLLGAWWVYGAIPLTVLWLPVILLPLVLGTLGVSWLLAAIGVFFRDVGHVMGVIVTILLFFSTIFYPAERLPESWRMYLYLNPLSGLVDQLRASLLFGEGMMWGAWVVLLAVSCLIFVLGYGLFMRLRRAYADML